MFHICVKFEVNLIYCTVFKCFVLLPYFDHFIINEKTHFDRAFKFSQISKS